MTQEKLAEILSISPQAVSRWENDAAMPDISLLLPIANLFSVTTDQLLGADSYQREQRKKEYDDAFCDYWRREDKEENYRIALRAVAEYPGNTEYLEWLASNEYYIGLAKAEYFERLSILESSVKHYKAVIENTKPSSFYDKSLYGIVLALNALGKKDEAKEYAWMQEDPCKRDEMLIWCTDGAEKEKIAHRVINYYLSGLLTYINFCGCKERFASVQSILETIIPDGNYQYYHNVLQYNCLDKAKYLCNEGSYDEAVRELQRAKRHAEEMIKYRAQKKLEFTSPLLRHIDDTHDEGEDKVCDVVDFTECLINNKCFDVIRNRDDFKALIDIN